MIVLELFKVGHCWHPEAMVFRNFNMRKIKFPAYVGLIRHPTKGLVLFDTGYAKRFADVTKTFPERAYSLLTPMELSCKENLIEQLTNNGVSPSDIKYIFISHFHADHIAGLLDFADAKFICSKVAFTEIMRLGRLSGLIKGYLKKLVPIDFHKRCIFIEDLRPTGLDRKLKPFHQGFDLFSDGSLLAIKLPGHAAGHYGLYYAGSNSGTFLVGDAVWTKDAYEKSIYPNPLAYLIMDSRKAYIETLDDLAKLYGNNKQLKIIPSHCEQSFIEYSRVSKN